MLSDRFVFLVVVLFKVRCHVPASLTDIADMATWTSNFIYNTTPKLFLYIFKDERSVFCFRNVTTGSTGAFDRFNCLMKL